MGSSNPSPRSNPATIPDELAFIEGSLDSGVQRKEDLGSLAKITDVGSGVQRRTAEVVDLTDFALDAEDEDGITDPGFVLPPLVFGSLEPATEPDDFSDKTAVMQRLPDDGVNDTSNEMTLAPYRADSKDETVLDFDLGDPRFEDDDLD